MSICREVDKEKKISFGPLQTILGSGKARDEEFQLF